MKFAKHHPLLGKAIEIKRKLGLFCAALATIAVSVENTITNIINITRDEK
jgi:hypothetical protein